MLAAAWFNLAAIFFFHRMSKADQERFKLLSLASMALAKWVTTIGAEDSTEYQRGKRVYFEIDREFKRVTYSRMVWQVWRPVESFYDQKLISALKKSL